jgi:predicted nucleotidyltransferase
MPTSWLDLSDQVMLAPLAGLVTAVRDARADAQPLLIGAMARDVLLSFAHGVHVGRATADMDFAFALDSWADFAGLKDALVKDGAFTEDTHLAHRLIFAGRYRVDLVPFGGVERADRRIAWPPDEAVQMHVLGYREAMANAVEVRLPGEILLAVASLPAQAVLKLFAWRDRRHIRPGVDAGDLRLLMRSYLDAGNGERLYSDAAPLLDMGDFDHARAAAWLLGHDARRLLARTPSGGGATLAHALELLAAESDLGGALRLVQDMRSGDAQGDLDLLRAFRAGLGGAATP